jgi:chromosome segregation protein
MLKRLQLVGFKSFADKTEFDFSDGLTAIVGPNGSGKSNIVDAVRWVMGEQSARSLRGGEMADVIFNGSSSRRSLGLAEVTLTFDNNRRALATTSSEISITRRVYRSGEGEYLINNQPCRLKDIKDLFLGSGAGNDAYSIIEQGRVDVLLQASTKERRGIFEEAAGISRFRARKTETLRKLERVDANLLRLRDIMDEVEKQLRSVRLQASKAQRYKEHTERLKELRIGLGLQEYDRFAKRLADVTASLEALRKDLQKESDEAEGTERQLHDLEQTLDQIEQSLQEQQTGLAEAQQQIATDTVVLEKEGKRSTELKGEIERMSGQVVEVTLCAAAVSAVVTEAVRELEETETGAAAKQSELDRLDADHAATTALLVELRQRQRTDTDNHLELMRQAGQLENDVISCKVELENASRARNKVRKDSDETAGTLASLERQLADTEAAESELQQRLSAARQSFADARQERERLTQVREETTRLASELRAARSGLSSRIEVLEALERSHEGINSGAREVLALLDQPDPGVWRTVLGIVADFLSARREYAPLIDLALGEKAHHFLARDPAQLREALAQRSEPFSGRISFLVLGQQNSETPQTSGLTSLPSEIEGAVSPDCEPGRPGVLAMAENVVVCESPELGDLSHRLLGRTLIVRDLDTARALAAHSSGFRFVTLAGELLEVDGTLTVGAHHAESGLISRKSELRDLREQMAHLDGRVDAISHDLAELTRMVGHAETAAADRQQEIQVLTAQAADLRSRLDQHRERREGLHEQVELNRSEMDRLERAIQELEANLQRAREAAHTATSNVREAEIRIAATGQEILQAEEAQQRQREACSAVRVILAQVGERLRGQRERVKQLRSDLDQREQQRRQVETRLRNLRQNLEDCDMQRLNAGASLARCCVNREEAARALDSLNDERERLRQQQQAWSEQAKARRQTWQARQEEVHARDLEVSDVRHQLDTLIGRLQEDYQLDLAEMYRKGVESGEWGGGREGTTTLSPLPTPHSSLPLLDPVEANEEMEELKRKLSRLGSVNLDALQELEELETRAGTLQTQLDDLSAAKRSLEDIINRINTDSRKLFSETLAGIRVHFQELFRKLFGGGQADIVLEDESDILESGIEIIARPPGKELRSISLMSGGEKTLTAVALLLAIFRFKPSPFCILDEVDAALDEANIGRLAAVLREFLDRSQFILITHSKRTMATADVLYGVTMQESGVSKRISVRFEDWPDDERQSPSDQVA